MAKNQKIETQNTDIEVGYEYSLADKFANNSALSLRKLATVLEVNYNMLLKKGKAAVPGEIYNPEAINYNAIEDYVRGQLGGPEDWDAINWDDVAAAEVSNKAALAEKFSVPGALIKIRGKEQIYEISIVTPTHIVLMPTDGVDTQPRLFSHATFMHQGPKEVK